MAKTTEIDADRYRVRRGEKVRLDRRPTRVASSYDSENDYRARLEAATLELRRRQTLLYAHDRYSLLIILQAMDAAGKDGVIKHVIAGVNPQGCQVHSFKHPSGEELEHDFLWRAAQRLPERGKIGIFNRSYYEEVLIVRVHPELLEGQRLPKESGRTPEIWRSRFKSIRTFERHLHRNGTRMVKIFLHLSKEEQRKRFLARLDDPEKNWKFGPSDVTERRHWKRYLAAYEDCLSNTSTPEAPWYAVPADDKLTARLIVSKILLETLRALPLAFPKTDAAERRRLKKKLQKGV
jgi:PPK2 family polyphosphate:nucleotide phosphotransferase